MQALTVLGKRPLIEAKVMWLKISQTALDYEVSKLR
jgi:hypothetical protein